MGQPHSVDPTHFLFYVSHAFNYHTCTHTEMQTLTKVAYEVSQKTQYTAKTEPFVIYEMQQKMF